MKKPFAKSSTSVIHHIDPNKKVRVYLNYPKSCYSVKQNGLVVCHASMVILKDFQTIVSRSGQNKVRAENRKNVHSYVEGQVVSEQEVFKKNKTDMEWRYMHYNPYTTDYWTDSETGKFVYSGQLALLDNDCRVLVSNNFCLRD